MRTTTTLRASLFIALAALLTLSAGCDDDSKSSYGGSYDAWSSSDTSSSGGWDATTTSAADTWGGSQDTSSASDTQQQPTGNTNVNLGGAQDFGYARGLLDAGVVPNPADLEPAGFFAEHHTPLPTPDCGEQVCLQAMLGVMANLLDGANCTLLQLGLNSTQVADPSQRPPLTLAVVVDTSGSMSTGSKMAFTRDGLTQMVNELKDDDQLAIVTYSNFTNLAFPMQPVGGNRNTLRDVIEGLEPDASTNIHDGLRAGYQEVLGAYDSGRQNRVILISDGVATAGITNTQTIVEMSRAFNSDGVGLTTIGLGTDFNYELMSSLAEQADGNFYFVEDAGAVDEVFSQELSYFTVPVAYDLELSLRAGADFNFGRAFGSSFFESTPTGGTLSVPSVFLAHRVSHSDVEPDGGRRGGGSALLIELMPRPDDGTQPEESEVAVIDVSFREPGTDRIVEDTVVVGYPYAPWFLVQSGHFDNTIVTKSFVMLNIYTAFEQACALFHTGRSDEAVALIRRVIAGASDYEDSANDATGDVDIQFDIALLEQLEDVILMNTPVPEEEIITDIPEDPWPAD